jgi:hypothetical protein
MNETWVKVAGINTDTRTKCLQNTCPENYCFIDQSGITKPAPEHILFRSLVCTYQAMLSHSLEEVNNWRTGTNRWAGWRSDHVLNSHAEVLGYDLGQNISYHDSGYSWFFLSLFRRIPWQYPLKSTTASIEELSSSVFIYHFTIWGYIV